MNADFSSLPSVGASVTTPVALVGLLVACICIVSLKMIEEIRKTIQSIPENQRARVLKLMEPWARTIKFLAVLGAFVFLASLAMLVVPQARSTVPAPVPEPNDRVLYYKGQILGLRGDIEAKYPTLEVDLRKRGLQLADQIGEIEESQLRPASKIIQHEYRGWAFLMGVSTFAATPPEYIPAAIRIDYAKKAVAELDLALARMADITREAKANVRTAIIIYDWMTGPSEDLNRTHYLKAVALAVIARAGGGSPQAALDELKAIQPTYLMTFSAESNPDLAWALGRSAAPRSPAENGPKQLGGGMGAGEVWGASFDASQPRRYDLKHYGSMVYPPRRPWLTILTSRT